MRLTFEKPAIPKNLDEVLENDTFNLFVDVKPKKNILSSDPLSQKFAEIMTFAEKHGREPSNSGEMSEKLLARALKSIRKNTEHCKKLAEFDRLQLLTPHQQAVEKQPEIATLEDILNDDLFGLLDMGDTSILELKHIQPSQPKAINGYEGEEVGKRTVCEDFERFKPIFQWLHQQYAAKRLIAKTEISERVEKGDLFILQGMFCLVVDKQFEARQSERKNARLRVIFENGTESNMLARSLSRAVQKDEAGKRLMFSNEQIHRQYQEQLFGKLCGYIYVAKLVELKAELAQFSQLHKIGFTTESVEERLKNCEKDIAFLESKVKKVLSFACYNHDPHKLETLLHGFFAARRLQLSLISQDGKHYQPKEWFDVGLETIQQAVLRILDGTIGEYRLDSVNGEMVKHSLSNLT